MDSSSSFSLTSVVAAAAIGFFTALPAVLFLFYGKFRSHQETKTAASSSFVPSSLPHTSNHHVFPSFHGVDVRRSFLSHILKEFRSKAIDIFIDNDIVRSKSIGPELVEAIRGSRIAIVLLSKNYASSTWCLDELVEIINCREELTQTVMVLFYEVDPTDVKKQTGEFGKVFRNTCKGKTKADIGRWERALAEVAKIAGYHSRNWDTESEMIETIATDVSNKLNISTPSSDFDRLVGMESHMINMRQLLRLDLEEVRIIGIWGPSGIGKTTIARFLYNRHSKGFQLSVFMENIRARYRTPTCSDEYSVKLHLQEQFMSRLINQKGFKIPHLGIIKDRLKDKKVLVVLDDLDQLVQLEAMAKETCWFGRWSRIIITTQNRKLLQAGGVNHTYKVEFPSRDEAVRMFCMYAFGQETPEYGFAELVKEVTRLAGELPLGLRVMGSYFRGMSKQDWTNALPRLRTRLDGEIESILKFSYDVLCDEDKNIFLHIASFFNNERVNIVEGCLTRRCCGVTQGLHVLAEKSLISMDWGMVKMHNLLVQLGKEMVRKKYDKSGKRQYLDDARDIGDVLSDDKADCSNVIGIDLTSYCDNKKDIACISERAFEKLYNLQFLRINGNGTNLPNPNFVTQKLSYLSWEDFQMPCLPSSLHPNFLVKLDMQFSKLEKLWEGIQPLSNLKLMDLSFSESLKELPDLSTATELCELNLNYCSSLVKIPPSIANAVNLQTLNLNHCFTLVELPTSIGTLINLQELELNYCSSLVELPSSIGNAINLRKLELTYCSNLVELPSSIWSVVKDLDLSYCSRLVELPSFIGNAMNLQKLNLTCCSSLVELPFSIENAINLKDLDLSWSSMVKLTPSIGNLINLQKLNLRYCYSLVELPFSIGNAIKLQELILFHCKRLVELPSSIGNAINLEELNLSYCSSLVRLPTSMGNATNLQKLDLRHCSSLVELPSSIGNAINLQELDLSDCSSLVKIPSSIGNAINLLYLNLSDCSSLVELPTSIGNAINLEILNLSYCSSLVRLPTSMGNAINLRYLNISDCSSLVELPTSIGNAINLEILNLRGCSSLVKLPSSIKSLHRLRKLNLKGCSGLEVPFTIINLESLEVLGLSDCSLLKDYHETPTNIEGLRLNGAPSMMEPWPLLKRLVISSCEMRELGPRIGRISSLLYLTLRGMQNLVSLPRLPDSLSFLHAKNCESLERLDCSFHNPDILLLFVKCFKLNQEARDLIIQTPTSEYAVLPGGEVPVYFTYRASRSSLTVKLNQKPLCTSTKFKACIIFVNKDGCDFGEREKVEVYCGITSKQNALTACISDSKSLEPVLPEHLYTFEVEAMEVTSTELVFEFKFRNSNEAWEIKECGIFHLLEVPSC